MSKRYRNWVKRRASVKRSLLPERAIGYITLGSTDPAQRCKHKKNHAHYE